MIQETKHYRKIVVKVGSKIITSGNANLDRKQVSRIVKQIVAVIDRNTKVILVSSGAIAGGMGLLGLKSRPKSLPLLQASAAIGQSRLMKIYDHYFQKSNIISAQLLLTQTDLSDRKRYLNAKNTLLSLLDKKVIPIINENDTVATDEIKFGDNDRLSALVANVVEADCLVILTDVDGLFTHEKGKKKAKIDKVDCIDSSIEKLAYESTHAVSVGGMKTKIEAAKIVTSSGISCIIANGRKNDTLLKIIQGSSVGTVFMPKKDKLKERKKWIAFGPRPKGKIFVDEGAKRALIEHGKSLLSAGIMNLEGDFRYGDVISILDKDGREFARGLTNYSSGEVKLIKGHRTNTIEKVLGYKYYDEIVHRDNLVVL